MHMGSLSLSKIVQEIPEAASLRFSMLAHDRLRRGEDIIILSVGEAFFDIPLFPFDDLPVQRGYHYSDSRGIFDLRQKLSRYYFEAYQVKTDAIHEILISSGSKVLIFLSLAAIVDFEDEVIILEPAWVSYSEQVKIAQGKPIHVPYHQGIEQMEMYFTKRTKAIIINNPNNPSGKVYTKNELEMLFELARKHNLYIISDETYSEFVSYEPFVSMASFDQEKRTVIVINSLSKNLGISGWRIGYVIANRNVIYSILKLNQHIITCPATILEYYLSKYFDRLLEIAKPQIQKVIAEREAMVRIIKELGLECLPGSGTFYFFISIASSRLNSEKFSLRLLEEYGVATVPGIGYGNSCDKFIRVSIGVETPERVKKGLLSIRELLEKTK